ncbi:hypothetical protein T09_15708, partial [Trichinella sp. T9]
MYIVDCWGGAHPTLEKHIVRLTLYMMVPNGKKCDKIFVKKLSFFSFFLRVDLKCALWRREPIH